MMNSADSIQVVRLLIALWDGELNKSELIRKAKKKSEASKDYYIIIDRLSQDKKITLSREKTPKVLLLETGKELLSQLLRNSDFQFSAQIGKRSANVLLAVIRSQTLSTALNSNFKETNAVVEFINSYEAFAELAIEIYNGLNQEFHLDDLVPIYRIRREIGEKASRKNFDTWLLEMQSNDIFQLLEGSIEDSASDKIEDSIITKVNGLRCYVKRLDK
jgi:hypothetical protein